MPNELGTGRLTAAGHAVRLCRRCGERWAQERDGCCRRCSDIRLDTKAREAERLERRARELAHLQRRLPRPPGPIRTARYEGVEFDVMFDGT